IVPGKWKITGRHQIDFRSVPDQPNYYLSAEGGLERATANGVLEVPILSGAVDSLLFLRRLPAYLRSRTGPPPRPLFGGGTSEDDTIEMQEYFGSAGSSLRRKLSIVLRRRAELAIPEDPAVMHSLTRRWLDGAGGWPRAGSLLMHAKGLTAGMLDQLRTY